MSSNSIGVLLVVLYARAGFSEEIKCPSYRDKHPLSSVILFDGPPEEKTDLMPDTSTGSGDHANSSWDVAYIFASGRKLFLVCHFSGLDESKNITIAVEKKVRRCVFRTHAGSRPAELTCK